MELNRKVCQEFAKPEWSMDLNHGLSCAEQIQYVVKLEVGSMDHQRILILHIYDRKKVAAGETHPLWIILQNRKQYFTPTRRDDGSTFWGDAAFDNLGRYYLFKNKCAFCSTNDEKRIVQFCKTDQKDGFSCLSSLQSRMMYRGMLRKKHKMQRKITERMETVPGLSGGIKGWIDREITPAYIFYTYSKDKKEMDGHYTACR